MAILSCVRRSTLAVVTALACLAPHAAFGDEADEDRPAKRQMIVTVEDTQAVPKAKPRTRHPAPPQGASEEDINAYLRALRKDVRDAQRVLREADDAEDEPRLKDELREKKSLLSDEENRLTTKDTGMVAGGATLTALGGASLVASLFLAIGWGLSGLDGRIDEKYGWASLGCLGGGVLGISTGIPLLIAGNTRRPREVEEAFLLPLPAKPAVGLTMSLSF